MVTRTIILLGFNMLLVSSPLVAEPAPSMLSDQGQRLLMGPIEWAAEEGETPASKEPVKRVKKEGEHWKKKLPREGYAGIVGQLFALFLWSFPKF